jgi:hypothetical protein
MHSALTRRSSGGAADEEASVVACRRCHCSLAWAVVESSWRWARRNRNPVAVAAAVADGRYAMLKGEEGEEVDFD